MVVVTMGFVVAVASVVGLFLSSSFPGKLVVFPMVVFEAVQGRSWTGLVIVCYRDAVWL